MKLLQNNVLGGNKLNCFKATQMLGGPTHILILEFEIAKRPKLRGVLELWYQRGT